MFAADPVIFGLAGTRPLARKLDEVADAVRTERAVGNKAIVRGYAETRHAQGPGLALEDFGTGYASLTDLKKFPIDRLKLDTSSVTEVRARLNDLGILGSRRAAPAYLH